MGVKNAGMPAPPERIRSAKRALRIQLQFDFVLERELLEGLVPADEAGDHFLHLLVLQQQIDAVTFDAGVVRDHRQIFRALAAQRANQIFRDAGGAESAHQDRRAVLNAGNGRFGTRYALIHSFNFPSIFGLGAP